MHLSVEQVIAGLSPVSTAKRNLQQTLYKFDFYSNNKVSRYSGTWAKGRPLRLGRRYRVGSIPTVPILVCVAQMEEQIPPKNC